MEQISPAFDPGHALLFDDHLKQWLAFANPVETIRVTEPQQVIPALQHVEQQVERHRYAAAGWISYEAAPAFDESLSVHDPDSGFPLLYFALYKKAEPRQSVPLQSGNPPLFCWKNDITREEYVTAVNRVKEYIALGDTYQVNYTFRRRSPFAPEDLAGLTPLLQRQPNFFGGIIADERWTACSGSPELFFTLDNGMLTSRPMKGTAPRGLSYEDDRAQAEGLKHSAKNRAENVMITDMMRNDLGRIAEPGTVSVPELFSLEQYPTLHQMTSTVQAQTKASLSEIFRAIFPPASITGAPKKRTMEIITELESAPRRLYTGTMGFILPDGRAQFNVAIRTLLFDRHERSIEYGVGSGIVWDSDPEEEYEECRTKTFICRPPPKPFSLLETMHWTPEAGYAYLPEHLTRLANSAAYFNIPLDRRSLEKSLHRLAETLPPHQHKIRLLVDARANCSLETSRFEPPPPEYCASLTLAREPVEESCFLYHKTTNRDVYEKARAQAPSSDDVLLFNDKGELTETTIANIIMEIGGVLYTPPVHCGLLPGTARAHLLASGRLVEKVLPVSLLKQGHPLFLVNSVRGIYRAELTAAAEKNN